MDIHRLEWVRVGSAKAFDVRIGVAETVAGSLRMLVGLSFIKQFRTIFDFEGHRVLFRSRTSLGP